MAKKNTRKGKHTPPATKKVESSTTKKMVAAEPEKKPEVVNEPVLSKSAQQPKSDGLPFGKQNYILLGIGVALIALGFFLMSLDEFVDATQFSISLHIAPWLVVGGFVEIVYAIMYQPKPAATA